MFSYSRKEGAICPTSTGAWLPMSCAPGEQCETSLAPGVFCFRVEDSVGQAAFAEVTVPQVVKVTVEVLDASCTKVPGGTCTLTATAESLHSGDPTYRWSGEGIDKETQIVTGLTAGEYQVVATDRSGCFDTASVTLPPPIRSVPESGANDAPLSGGDPAVFPVQLEEVRP